MSSVLPFDVMAQIIDIAGENKDTNLLKQLALVSHSFLQICSKHLFATVDLHDAIPMTRICHVASSKKGFVKLLKSRPDVVKYIRKLTYKVGYDNRFQFPLTCPIFNNDDYLLSPILPNLLRTIPRLTCLTIATSRLLDWNTLDSPLASAFLHLMHLPTINHIDLSSIQSFPLSSLALSVNLHRLDLSCMRCSKTLEEDSSPEIIQSETIPQILDFHTSESTLLTRKLLHATSKRLDGRPAFNFIDLRRLSISFNHVGDEQNIRYLLQNAKSLEELHLSVGLGRSLVELHDILSPSARTLKALDLTVSLYDDSLPLPLAGICEELEAMAGHNILEVLSLEVHIDGHETEDSIGLAIQTVESVLLKPGWSALRQVSFQVSIACCLVSKEDIAKLSQALQSLPDKYLSHLPRLESVAFNYSACAVKCAFIFDD